MKNKFTIIIKKEQKWFVATCPESDVTSQGKTARSAEINLREAIELYLEN